MFRIDEYACRARRALFIIISAMLYLASRPAFTFVQTIVDYNCEEKDFQIDFYYFVFCQNARVN